MIPSTMDEKESFEVASALTAIEPALYKYGLSLLQAQKKFNDDEIERLASYLPTQEYKAQFKSLFVKA